MALNAITMADAIATKIVAANPDAVKAEIKTLWIPICEGIIDHFTSSGEVLPGTFQDAEARPITGAGEIS